MKYSVTVCLQITGEIEVEAGSFDEAQKLAKSEARFNNGEKLMSPTIDSDALFATDANGEEHEYDN